MSQLLRYFHPNSDMLASTAYLYATGIIFCIIMSLFTTHLGFFILQQIGMRLRIACCSIIYRKVSLIKVISKNNFHSFLWIQCLLLNQRSLGKTSIGQMVNLMSNDVNRFDRSVLLFNYLWVAPMQALIATVILFRLIGWYSFFALGFFVFFTPTQSSLHNIFEKYTIILWTQFSFSSFWKTVFSTQTANGCQNRRAYSYDERNPQWNSGHQNVHLGKAFCKTDRAFSKVYFVLSLICLINQQTLKILIAMTLYIGSK